MPKLREKAPEKVSFTIRYEAATLARIDAYAERGGITRAEATRAVLAAGIEALDAVGGPTLADVMQRLDELQAELQALPSRVPPEVHRRQGERRTGPRPDAGPGKRRADRPQP